MPKRRWHKARSSCPAVAGGTGRGCTTSTPIAAPTAAGSPAWTAGIDRPDPGARPPMKVNLVYNRIPHHAGRAGYDQIVRYLQGRVPIRSLEDYMTRFLSDYSWAALAERSSGWVARRAGMD